jgi:putative membrane protein
LSPNPEDENMNHRITLCVTAATALLALGACNKQEAADANPGQSEPVNAAQDATSAAVGQTSAATLGANTLGGYVSNAAMGDMYEIEAGKMAQERAKAADVKSFGQMLVTDHTAASNEMKPLATAAGQTPPTELDERRKGLLDNLRAASAGDFDKTFLSQQVAAHEEALTLHRGYADNGDTPALKTFAAKIVPKLEQHLARARELEGAGGAAPAKK